MTTFAAAERARLADLLLEKGPHAPTLCGGWSTRDLAAHLWLRESRPDAFAALFIPPLFLRTSTAPVVLQGPGRAPVTVTRGAVALRAPVTVTGEVGELLLWASGRDAVHVEIDGDASAAVRTAL